MGFAVGWLRLLACLRGSWLDFGLAFRLVERSPHTEGRQPCQGERVPSVYRDGGERGVQARGVTEVNLAGFDGNRLCGDAPLNNTPLARNGVSHRKTQSRAFLNRHLWGHPGHGRSFCNVGRDRQEGDRVEADSPRHLL